MRKDMTGKSGVQDMSLGGIKYEKLENNDKKSKEIKYTRPPQILISLT